MYFPIGWPKILHSRSSTGGGRPMRLLRHRTKNLIVELRERSLSFWNSRVRLIGQREGWKKNGDGVVLIIAHPYCMLPCAARCYDLFPSSSSSSCSWLPALCAGGELPAATRVCQAAWNQCPCSAEARWLDHSHCSKPPQPGGHCAFPCNHTLLPSPSRPPRVTFSS